MKNKIKKLSKQHKKILSFVGMFILGVVVAFGTMSLNGMTLEGRTRLIPVNTTTHHASNGTCNLDNCDLANELSNIKSNYLGDSTWTLYDFAYNSLQEMYSRTAGLNSKIGNSTWTLFGFADNSLKEMYSSTAGLNSKIGDSTWTILGINEHYLSKSDNHFHDVQSNINTLEDKMDTIISLLNS